MNDIQSIIISCMLLIYCEVSFSSTNNYWRCYANDSSHKQWSFDNKYQRMALNQSLEYCKKQSENPMTCQVSQERCEFYRNGLSTRPMWQCTALDAEARVWKSRIYSHHDNAVLGAKAYCHQHSPSPDSCYAYVTMCSNLNEN